MTPFEKLAVDTFPLAAKSKIEKYREQFRAIDDFAFDFIFKHNGAYFWRRYLDVDISLVEHPNLSVLGCMSFTNSRWPSNCFDSYLVGPWNMEWPLLKQSFNTQLFPILTMDVYNYALSQDDGALYVFGYSMDDLFKVADSFEEFVLKRTSLTVYSQVVDTIHEAFCSLDEDRLCEIPIDLLQRWRFGEEQFSVLHFAVINGFCRFAKFLIDKGFDPFETDSKGRNCLHLAALHCFDSLKMLTPHIGKDLERRDAEGKTALYYGNLQRAAIWLYYHGANFDDESVQESLKSRSQDPFLENEPLIRYLTANEFRDDIDTISEAEKQEK
ncbi:MAG: ankyrin repeat domain-containing protein [Pirellulaceae bacterium]|jgi:hypothetical protein|nr:ankyrin repeat domain-containing protein [Pirellulaceae bacterium]